ncbi:hypothetical protein L3Q82_010084, partial [Scortum barcoo]
MCCSDPPSSFQGGACWSPMVDTRSEEVSITAAVLCLVLSSDFCELTVDTNTVNREIKLSDNNRTATVVMKKQPYPDHPERFDFWRQLLCETGLTGRCYWEVEWRGRVSISVSYRRIRRRGDGEDCWFGLNDHSWSLSCSDDGRYSVWHNKIEASISSSSSSSSSSVSHRVAVYVDCPAGTLSFYRVSSDTLIHLHTFNTTFTEPLYPGFGFGSGVLVLVVWFLSVSVSSVGGRVSSWGDDLVLVWFISVRNLS